MRRRSFLGLVAASPLLIGSRGLAAADDLGRSATRRVPLPRPTVVGAQDLTLTARPAVVDLGHGSSEAWTLNGSFPGPTIRIRRGERARITLRNELDEDTILHWHGLNVPEAADGHPRLAIGPGSSYRYEFDVRDRPGLYWYHPHTHERTAPQTYLGMAGLIVVEGDEEEALELPSGDFELPLVLQDKRLGPSGDLRYEPAMGHDLMMGFLGDTPFANGVSDAAIEVQRGVYRLRVLNAANARIFDLGLSTLDPMTLIGTDGGLLDARVTVDRVMMATGERADLLVDFSRYAPGNRITLRSHPFTIPGMGMMGMGVGMGRGRPGMRPGGMRGRGTMGGVGGLQGTAMDLVEFVVGDQRGPDAPALPARLTTMPSPAIEADTPVRRFRFNSTMMRHTINDRRFEMERVDARIPQGRTEIWSIRNEAGYAHPVHVHAGQFRILSRSGGRAALMPWETGRKDTVLVLPGETVDIAVRFDDHRGLFLLHCHNLEHEDNGMMANFSVGD